MRIFNHTIAHHKIGFLTAALAAVLTVALGGCIENDLPFPRIQQNIIAIAAEGEVQPALIDSAKLEATLYLSEETDPARVKITQFEVSPGAEVSPDPIEEGEIDLLRPRVIDLKKYQTYQWVISAEQNIERYFTVRGQIGESVIDAVGRRVIVRMPMTANLMKCELTSVKLGPKGNTVMIPALTPGEIDLSRPLHVDVESFGRSQEWIIFTEKTELLCQTTAADAWSMVMWVYGEGPATEKGSFRYREKGSEEWISVPAASVTQAEGSGSFSACIPHLKPLTSYEVQALSGEHEGNVMEATTDGTEVLPDGSFDQWWKDKNVWCPWNEGSVQFWDTGNTGAATLGESNVVPSDDTPLGSGQSAKLETKFVGIAGIGKIAAGSIYTGKFAKVDGTNGILDFGRPWRVRPTKLRGYMKFHTEPINYTSTEFKQLNGRPDSCHIYVAMTDWASPYQIRTNPKNRQLFNANAPEIIAYGELVLGADTNGWQEFTIELKYRSTSRKPRYIQVTCAASKYGDYFTGGTGTCLWVDQLSLDYDY